MINDDIQIQSAINVCKQIKEEYNRDINIKLVRQILKKTFKLSFVKTKKLNP